MTNYLAHFTPLPPQWTHEPISSHFSDIKSLQNIATRKKSLMKKGTKNEASAFFTNSSTSGLINKYVVSLASNIYMHLHKPLKLCNILMKPNCMK